MLVLLDVFVFMVLFVIFMADVFRVVFVFMEVFVVFIVVFVTVTIPV